MEETKDIKKYQEIVDNEFRKILKIKINNRELKIAISKNEVPVIKNFDIDDNSFVISFEEFSDKINNDKEFDIIWNKQGEIIAVTVNNLNRFRSENYFYKFRKRLIDIINSYPDNNSKETLKKHKQKRIAHAISEILKTVPNTGSTQIVHRR